MCRPLLLALLCALAPAASRAQDGGQPDQPEPDPEIEEGSAGVGRVVEKCERGGDCTTGFACVSGKCQWQGTRRVDNACGFGGGPIAALLFAALAVAGRPQRRKRSAPGADGDADVLVVARQIEGEGG